MVIYEDFIGECIRVTESESDFVGINVLFDNYCKWSRREKGEDISVTEKIKKGFHDSFFKKMENRGVKKKDIQMECGTMTYYHGMRLK